MFAANGVKFHIWLCFKLICGEDIPGWVNRLAYLSTYVPFIEKMIPKEWISPAAIQHTLDQHKSETSEQFVQNGASTTRLLYPDESSSFSSNNEQRQQQQQEPPSQQNQSKSKTIWPEIFTSGQAESNDQNKAVWSSNPVFANKAIDKICCTIIFVSISFSSGIHSYIEWISFFFSFVYFLIYFTLYLRTAVCFFFLFLNFFNLICIIWFFFELKIFNDIFMVCKY